MSKDPIPSELLAARKQIDAVDEQLIDLLATRFQLTHQVGLLKASEELSALDAERESEKLARIKDLCEVRSLDPTLVTELFSRIMQAVVRNHEKLRQDH